MHNIAQVTNDRPKSSSWGPKQTETEKVPVTNRIS